MNNFINLCTNAIRDGDNEPLIALITKTPSRNWCSECDTSGDTLLHYSILQNNKEAFDFLLPLYNPTDLEVRNNKNYTALMVPFLEPIPISEDTEHFVKELIKNGASIRTLLDDPDIIYLLHRPFCLSLLKMIKLLLEAGFDVNKQDTCGDTILHNVLKRSDTKYPFEFVSFLLCYGADPFIRNSEGYIPFEYAVKYNHLFATQETLFYYTFDEFTSLNINMEILLRLAKLKSPLFYHLINNDKIKFVVGTYDIHLLMNALLHINREYLNILLEKNHLLEELFICNMSTVFSVSGVFRLSHYDHIRRISFKQIIENLNILFESKYKVHALEFFRRLHSIELFDFVVKGCTKTESGACDLLIYLLSYGLSFEHFCYEIIYVTYGYCELFKLMLTIGANEGGSPSLHNFYSFSMCRLICDIDCTLVDIFGSPIQSISLALELLNFFVHPKLEDSLRCLVQKFRVIKRRKGKNNVIVTYDEQSIQRLARLDRQPKMPSLVQLSRDLFRRYFTETFGIENESQFYKMVKKLPIGRTYQKIITYERKIYM